MFERILVSLDGSPQAEATLPYVEDIAARLGSEVILLEVCETDAGCASKEGRDYLERLTISVRENLAKRRAASASPAPPEARIRTAIVTGDPAESILDYAAKNGAGLIVMAAHGRSGKTRWAVGSVADKVLRATKLPVALISGKPPAGHEVLRKALLPLDGSKVGETALPYAEELALKMGAELVLLQVLEFKYIAYGAEIGGYVPYPQEWLTAAEESARDYLSGVEKRLRAKGINVSWRLESGAAADTIIQVAETIRADFIAMSTHGRSGVGRWVFGSVADRVVHSGKFPVFLVHAPQEHAK